VAEHPARLLVADDNKVNRLLLSRSLEVLGHRVASAENGRVALDMLRAEHFDLLLLDMEMPELDGFQVLEQLVADTQLRDLPVIVTSSLEGVAHVARCIELGADDYLPKPFAFSELLARLRALSRRSPELAAERLVAGEIELDPVRHQVRVGDKSELLSAREYALLGYLIRHEGQVVTRQQILDSVWGAEPDVYSNVVDLYVHYLRRKLTVLGQGKALATVRGVGYALRP